MANTSLESLQNEQEEKDVGFNDLHALQEAYNELLSNSSLLCKDYKDLMNFFFKNNKII